MRGDMVTKCYAKECYSSVLAVGYESVDLQKKVVSYVFRMIIPKNRIFYRYMYYHFGDGHLVCCHIVGVEKKSHVTIRFSKSI